MILIGIDDTDVADSPGTNQLARRIARRLPRGFVARVVVRHQLLLDPSIPYTSRNGSASIGIDADPGRDARELLPLLRSEILEFAPPGSDPGLCVATHVPAELAAFGERCKADRVTIDDAYALAEARGIIVEGLGGTNGGVIGALAAVALLDGGNDGRVVHMRGWPWPDDAFTGSQPARAILERGVHEIRDARSGMAVETGVIDIGTRLRPAWRNGRVVLFVAGHAGGQMTALKLA